MGLVLQYRPQRMSTGGPASRLLAKGRSTGQILMFTGVRYERYESVAAEPTDVLPHSERRWQQPRRKRT